MPPPSPPSARRRASRGGAPARTDPILDAEAALIDRLRRDGHPLASVVDREVTVDHEATRMDVVWTLAAGPRTSFAVPVITGETAVDPALTARVAGTVQTVHVAVGDQVADGMMLVEIG